MHFNDIPQYTSNGNYHVNVGWDYLQEWLKDHLEDGLNMDPDFQRGHVWTEEQQIAFVEHALKGGRSGMEIFFNQPGWMTSFRGEFVLVDGKQRITAVLRFLNNEIMAFGTYFKDFEGSARLMRANFSFHVNNLKTRAEVLKWYLEMNSGGTPHTRDELERVRKMLSREKNKASG